MTNIAVEGHHEFHILLHQQIGRAFTASQQSVAIAIYFDANQLRRLAQHFYAQAKRQRGHALRIVRYLLDRDVSVEVAAIERTIIKFVSAHHAVGVALNQENEVTQQITALTRAARDGNDFLGESFMLWFLKEQAENVATMTKLLTVVDAAADNIFRIESYAARELNRSAMLDPGAPKAAGGCAC